MDEALRRKKFQSGMVSPLDSKDNSFPAGRAGAKTLSRNLLAVQENGGDPKSPIHLAMNERAQVSFGS